VKFRVILEPDLEDDGRVRVGMNDFFRKAAGDGEGKK